MQASREDSLQHSKLRINAYRALSSPCFIALSSTDPILTAFELSWETKRLGRLENEFKVRLVLLVHTQDWLLATLTLFSLCWAVKKYEGERRNVLPSFENLSVSIVCMLSIKRGVVFFLINHFAHSDREKRLYVV